MSQHVPVSTYVTVRENGLRDGDAARSWGSVARSSDRSTVDPTGNRNVEKEAHVNPPVMVSPTVRLAQPKGSCAPCHTRQCGSRANRRL
ncbi:hypothetical protein BDY21DRAFT_330637 [Lineolata rhizophorae]|uniref:Uncharacterized protein n=1 Tax=Lineolata rhizophorae TaxID=578093 RepID=A0A6A6PEC2_9PEZI|nr:hypothetical protein BDY21DRAFT_330637 [Lineolata rhizophorae]